MWRLKYWLSRLGSWLWLRCDKEKIYIAFRHTKCGSEVVQLAEFRPQGGEFQCFNCSALVPPKDIAFRVLSKEEMNKITKQIKNNQGSDVLPHIATA